METKISSLSVHFQDKKESFINKSWRGFIFPLADYVDFLLKSPVWPYLKGELEHQKQKDGQMVQVQPNESWRKHIAISTAWEKVMIVYKMIHSPDIKLLEDERLNHLGFVDYIQEVLKWRERPLTFSRDHEDDLKEGFERIHSFIMSKVLGFEETLTPSVINDKLFGFDGLTFTIRRLDSSLASINFYPTKGETTGPYCLLKSFVELLIKQGKRDGDLFKVKVTRQEIREYFKKHFPELKIEITNEWISNTRGNLLRKIPEQHQDLINIGYYDKKLGIYPFHLKLPD